jgi:hypothetical protein
VIVVHIVPDAEPNADSVPHEIEEFDSLAALPQSWREREEVVARYIPEGWHVVRFSNGGEGGHERSD